VNPPPNPLAANAGYNFTATVADQFGDVMALGPSPTWTSNRGFMDAGGLFFAQQPGDYTITATLRGGASASLTVSVVPAVALLSNITRSVTTTSATIQWTTNMPADSIVEYGFDLSYGSTVSDATLVTAHKVVLSGLAPGRIYHYRVHSTNASGKESVSPDLMFATSHR
jgi:hypothetical protein